MVKLNLRTKRSNLLKYALLMGVVICCFSCGEYIPHKELNGHVLTDSDGKKYKLEWLEGRGESWRFLEEVKSTSDSTKKRWVYVSSSSFSK